MAKDDIDLQRQAKKENTADNNSLKTIIVIAAITVASSLLFSIATIVINTNLLNSKLASLNNAESEDTSADSEDEETIKHGVVIDLGDFILNLADENQRRYLKTNVAIEVSEPEQPEGEVKTASKDKEKAEGGGEGEGAAAAPSDLEKKLNNFKPAIRDAVITNLSSKTAVELSTAAGKELAKEQIMAAINGVLAGQNEVLRVSFGQFIIQ